MRRPVFRPALQCSAAATAGGGLISRGGLQLAAPASRFCSPDKRVARIRGRRLNQAQTPGALRLPGLRKLHAPRLWRPPICLDGAEKRRAGRKKTHRMSERPKGASSARPARIRRTSVSLCAGATGLCGMLRCGFGECGLVVPNKRAETHRSARTGRSRRVSPEKPHLARCDPQP